MYIFLCVRVFFVLLLHCTACRLIHVQIDIQRNHSKKKQQQQKVYIVFFGMQIEWNYRSFGHSIRMLNTIKRIIIKNVIV